MTLFYYNHIKNESLGEIQDMNIKEEIIEGQQNIYDNLDIVSNIHNNMSWIKIEDVICNNDDKKRYIHKEYCKKESLDDIQKRKVKEEIIEDKGAWKNETFDIATNYNYLNIEIPGIKTEYIVCNSDDNQSFVYDEHGNSQNITKVDNKHVKKEIIVDVQDIKIMDENFKDNHCEGAWTNNNLSVNKSENIACNNEDKKSYLCRFCEYASENVNIMKKHVQIHFNDDKNYAERYKFQTNTAVFMCDECGYRSSKKAHLSTHIRCHAKKKLHSHKTVSLLKVQSTIKNIVYAKSSICSQYKPRLPGDSRSHSRRIPYYIKTTGRTHLISHIGVHNSKRPKIFNRCSNDIHTSAVHKCKYCDIDSFHKSNKPSQQHTCDLCDYSTRFIGNLKRHIRLHTGDKRYSCEYCEYRTSDQSGLASHRKRHKKVYEGNKEDSIKTYLLKHHVEHNKGEQYACVYCDYTTSDKSALSVHKERHRLEKRYVCDQCDYITGDESCFTEHHNQHTSEGQMQKCYARTYSRACAGEKLACSACDFRCRYAATLAHHQRIHEDQRRVGLDHAHQAANGLIDSSGCSSG